MNVHLKFQTTICIHIFRQQQINLLSCQSGATHAKITRKLNNKGLANIQIGVYNPDIY